MFSMQRNRHILHIFSVYEIVYLSIDFLNKFLYVALLVCKVLNLQFKQIYLADPGTRNSYENEKDNLKNNSKVLGNQQADVYVIYFNDVSFGLEYDSMHLQTSNVL